MRTRPPRETDLSQPESVGVACEFFPVRKGHVSHELHNIVMSHRSPFRTSNCDITHEKVKRNSVKKSACDLLVNRHPSQVLYLGYLWLKVSGREMWSLNRVFGINIVLAR